MPTDIETGDVDFDRDFHLVGSPALVLALLNAETRRALVHLRWGPVRLSDVWLTAGKLWVDVPNAGGSAESHLAAIEQVTRLALEVAPLLRRPADLPQRLADNATQDPLPLVRLRNLSELLRNYRDHAVMHSVLGRAARDSEPEIRLRAGIELREGGLPILEALAADPRVEDACSARAVEALRGRVTVARAEELLKAAVGGFSAEALRPQTAGACIDLLGELGEAGIAALSRALWLDEPVGLTAVKALERIGGAAVESVLVSGLAIRDEERTVAIARALGGVGSVAAVAPLMEAARRGGKLKGAARQAIVEIQARTHGTPGQLSLTGGERGGLTLADDHAGQLSLVEPRRDPAKS
jgi:hypothetical protein